MYSMIHKETWFTRFIFSSLSNLNLLGDDSTLILTGSAALECMRASPNYIKYFNGESDIDLVVILYDDISFMDTLFSKQIIMSFYNNDINVLNYSYQYGNKRNSMNLKYIKEEAFIEWISLRSVHFTSYRKSSLLAKKPNMKCYGFFDYTIVPYQEESVSDYYILHYNVELNHKYYLLDVHSMILFGIIISENHTLRGIEEFNLFFRLLLNYSDEMIFNLFKYYLNEKKSISQSELKNFLKKFTDINIEKTLEILKKKGMIYEVRGDVKRDSQLGTICWARSDPKDVFDFMDKVSSCITSKKFILIVDDMCSKILYNRTDDEQRFINQKYLSKFTNCKIYFSSEIFKVAFSNKNFMEEFIDIMGKINLSYYIKFLPEKKTENMQSLKLYELIHTFCELFLLNYGEKILGIDTMIFGKFSQNITFLSKKFVFKDSKLNYIIIPRLDEKDMKLIPYVIK